MKKILIIFIAIIALSGCRNVDRLTTLPADSASFTYDKIGNGNAVEAIMTERATGEDVVLTKREVKQLKKDSSDVRDFRASLIMAQRKAEGN